MANIIIPPSWQGRESDVTPQDVYQNRRAFLKQLGLGAIGLASASTALACTSRSGEASNGQMAAAPDGPLDTIPADAPRDGLPAPRNAAFKVPERPLSDRTVASTYNNFYEFSTDKELWQLTGDYDPFPMTIEVSGLVEQKTTFDVADLMRTMGLEERIYRFRCVEAWSMTVPWTGFPLRKLIERCKPLSKATHVRFFSANRKDQMPGVRSQPWYEWPYYEALRMDEATNEVAFVATGLYGEPLPKQNGSPLRLALPWKYGYKGPKAIVKLEFVDKQPKTFWNDLAPSEYGFLSNVNPNIPHPRWSQATERLLSPEKRIPTQLFNGYGEWVADLYPDEPREPQRAMAR